MSINAAQRTSIQGACAMLGFPPQHWAVLTRWANDHDFYELDAYVDVQIADRCYRLRDDLLSELIRTGVDGLDLTTEEIQLAVRAMLTLAADAEKATDQTK